MDTTLHDARRKLIEELDKFASKLSYPISIVFDAPLQTEDLSRSYYRSLEIIFTSRGLTADEYLIQTLSFQKNPRLITLVTSDKPLARKAKELKVQVISVKEFITRMRKKTRKRVQIEKPSSRLKAPTRVAQEKKDDLIARMQEQAIITEKLEKEDTKKKAHKKKLPPLSDIERWKEIFEHKFTDQKDKE